MKRRRCWAFEERRAEEPDRAVRARTPQSIAHPILSPQVEALQHLQSTAGNRAVATALQASRSLRVQRDPKGPKPAARKPVTAPAAKGPRQRLFVVRDRALGLGGGTYVTDLAHFKRAVMATKDEGEWTLVLSIHGAEDRLGAQAPPDWQKNAVFYEAKDLDALFKGDKEYVKWRDEFGPTHLSMVSCQVSASFEGTLIDNLTRRGAPARTQGQRGLGEGCKPIASVFELDDAPKTRTAFNKLSASKQQSIKEQLSELNAEWGYYGAAPVPEDQLIHYYYEEAPKPGWVTVEVYFGKAHDLAGLKRTTIPYWNRTTGPKAAKFRSLCDQAVGGLKRTRQPTAPRPSDE